MPKKDYTMKQCKLIQMLENGQRNLTSWIPTKFAELNRILKLDGYEGNWKVVFVGPNEFDSKEVIANSRDYLNHRKVTDI